MKPALLLSYGKCITRKDDLLTAVNLQQVFEMIKLPNESIKTLIERLRLIKTIDKNQYGLLKRQLPYWVCGVFNPPYRRIENFGYTECFIVDIDHIAEKGLDINSLRAKFIADSRTALCFVSPGEDGLKVMFRLGERCSDAGRYSLFYKTFIQILAQQYGFEQVVDKTTSDVSRACFTSYDPDIFFNPDADAVNMKDFADFDNPFEISVLEHQLKKEDGERKKTRPKENEPPKGPGEDAFAFIKERLNARKNAVKNKPQVYVPEQLNQILEKLREYIAEVGVTIEEIIDIHYGKKFKFRYGISQAEVNLFFGKKGFSVVKSPRQGTSEQMNELMTAYIQAFISDYILLRENPVLNEIFTGEPSGEQDFNLIRNQAKLLYTEKNYREAYTLYHSLWESYREKMDEWDCYRYAYCTQKAKDSQTALDVCRKVYLKHKTFKNIKDVYAWTVYYSEIKKDKIDDEATFYRAGKGILELSSQEDAYSPYTLTVLKILDHLSEKSIYPADKILEWVEKLNPQLLDDKPFSFTDRDGKQREIASKKEQYYMLYSRALLEKGAFDECIKLCEEGLNALEHLHYGNEIWFRWRIALCYEGLGEFEKSLHLLLRLLDVKKEWFIQKEIAEQYLKLGDNQNCLKYALESATNSGDIFKKINLYHILADVLTRIGKTEEAKLHADFIKSIKDRYDGNRELEIAPQLKQLWQKLKYEDRPRYSGIIKSLLPNGKAGFVETDRNRSYYFSMLDFKASPKKATAGTKVSFYLAEGFDAKKNKKTMNAVNVEIIN
ncbi:MAG: hypothetical protein LBG45_03975 [Dysgonamonadaceae bacterium]|jgi:tetratricopeptide (TPR) repeat protein|nr:hypothetical protein [Dysgonamonadaceae bacterium]